MTQDLTLLGGLGAAATYLSCPAGTLGYTGGAFWHQADSPPTPALATQAFTPGNTATYDAVGWFASLRVAR